MAPAVSAAPPKVSHSLEFWAQPERALEIAGRPLDTTLAVFRSPRDAAQLPAPAPQGLSLPAVAPDCAATPVR